MTATAFGASGVLGLGADWECQSSSPSKSPTRATATGSDGDVIASKTHRDKETGTEAYIYKGAEVDFITALTAANALPGKLLEDAFLVTQVAVDYGPCASGKRPLCTFTYQDGPTAAPATPFYYTSNLTLPTYVAANVDVPPILTVTAGDAEVQTASWQLSTQVGEDLDDDGEYLASQCYGGEEQLSLQFTGKPTSITSTGWDQTAGPGTGNVNTNTGYDTTSYVFVRSVTRT